MKVEKYNNLLEEERQLFGKLDSRYEKRAESTVEEK